MFNKIGLSRAWGYTMTKLNGYWCMSILVLGFEWSGTFPYITVCNLGLLDSQFLLKRQKAFAQIHHQLCPFLNWEYLLICLN